MNKLSILENRLHLGINEFVINNIEMKKFLSILSLLFGLFLCVTVFSACSKDSDNNDPSNPLVGTWRAEVESKGEWQYWDITFNADFTYSTIQYNKDDSSDINWKQTGTYEIIEGNIIRTVSDSEYNHHPKGEVWTSEFKITDGNKLEFLAKHNGVIYYKIK